MMGFDQQRPEGSLRYTSDAALDALLFTIAFSVSRNREWNRAEPGRFRRRRVAPRHEALRWNISAAAATATHSAFSMRRLLHAKARLLQHGAQFLGRGDIFIEVNIDAAACRRNGYLAHAIDGIQYTRNIDGACFIQRSRQLQSFGFHHFPSSLFM
jgi:hypothetical protein